jgi:hypothetical protein
MYLIVDLDESCRCPKIDGWNEFELMNLGFLDGMDFYGLI